MGARSAAGHATARGRTGVGARGTDQRLEIIGLGAAAVPHAWLSLFSTDPSMLDAGSRYLRMVGPFYGLFGLGMALYFASQGAGRLGWPLLANLTRLAIEAGGAGWPCDGAATCRMCSSRSVRRLLPSA